jgi:arginine deiminase
VWEKGVKSNNIKELLAELPKREDFSSMQQSKLSLVAAATRDRRKEKEHMGDFIAKKREMFLVQMSLDTKRAEIRKLEERAQQREEVRRAAAARVVERPRASPATSARRPSACADRPPARSASSCTGAAQE